MFVMYACMYGCTVRMYLCIKRFKILRKPHPGRFFKWSGLLFWF